MVILFLAIAGMGYFLALAWLFLFIGTVDSLGINYGNERNYNYNFYFWCNFLKHLYTFFLLYIHIFKGIRERKNLKHLTPGSS